MSHYKYLLLSLLDTHVYRKKNIYLNLRMLLEKLLAFLAQFFYHYTRVLFGEFIINYLNGISLILTILNF